MSGEFPNIHQVRQHVVDSAKDLIQERLQDRSRWSACHFLIVNEHPLGPHETVHQR
jgi:hypothetical protein